VVISPLADNNIIYKDFLYKVGFYPAFVRFAPLGSVECDVNHISERKRGLQLQPKDRAGRLTSLHSFLIKKLCRGLKFDY
jgi:hypothetical protein